MGPLQDQHYGQAPVEGSCLVSILCHGENQFHKNQPLLLGFHVMCPLCPDLSGLWQEKLLSMKHGTIFPL